jgi:hypothetical protein
MNIFNVYSFVNDFDDFLKCAEDIENIEFDFVPTQFNHWCSKSDTEKFLWNCLDCCYIRKYHVRDYYVLINKNNISLHDNIDCDPNLGIYSASKLEFVCLLFHFKKTNDKKCVYISIKYIKPINNYFEDYIRETYFNQKTIRNLIDNLVKQSMNK